MALNEDPMDHLQKVNAGLSRKNHEVELENRQLKAKVARLEEQLKQSQSSMSSATQRSVPRRHTMPADEHVPADAQAAAQRRVKSEPSE